MVKRVAWVAGVLTFFGVTYLLIKLGALLDIDQTIFVGKQVTHYGDGVDFETDTAFTVFGMASLLLAFTIGMLVVEKVNSNPNFETDRKTYQALLMASLLTLASSTIINYIPIETDYSTAKSFLDWLIAIIIGWKCYGWHQRVRKVPEAHSD